MVQLKHSINRQTVCVEKSLQLIFGKIIQNI